MKKISRIFAAILAVAISTSTYAWKIHSKVPSEDIYVLESNTAGNFAMSASTSEEDIFVSFTLEPETSNTPCFLLSNITITSKEVPATNLSGKSVISLVAGASHNITTANINNKFAYFFKMLHPQNTVFKIKSDSRFIAQFLQHHGFQTQDV